MLGDGIDMYDLIPIRENDEKLYFTGQKFWVGVIEGMYPSPPIPRRKTKCFAPQDVYLYFGEKVFSMISKNGIKEFYKIPKRELIFVQ